MNHSDQIAEQSIPITSEARAQIVSKGRLRVGLNYGNTLLVNAGSPAADPQGLAPDIARHLAKCLQVEIEFVRFDHPAKLADAVRDAECDVGFVAADPGRAAYVEFTAPYLDIDVGCLVPQGSAISSIEMVDRSGIRIAVSERSAYDLWLSRNLKHAVLERGDGFEGSCRIFLDRKLEALAALKPSLVENASKFPGARILEGRFTAVHQAIGMPKNGASGAAYLQDYVRSIKAAGLIERMVRKHALKGVSVPGPF